METNNKESNHSFIIETSHLIIRPFNETDWKDLFEYLSLEEIYKFEPGEPIDTKIAQEVSKERSSKNEFYAVVLKTENKMIGHLYFNIIEPKHLNTYELGFIFNPKYQKKGYGTESAKELVKFGFSHLKIHRIVANCNPLNIPSWKLLENIGMKREGYLIKNIYFRNDIDGNPIWQDTYEYAILNGNE